MALLPALSASRKYPRLRAAALCVACTVGAPATAQVERLPWRSESVGVGITLKVAHDAELFGAPQSLSLLELAPAAALDGPAPCLDVAAPERPARIRTSKLATQRGALAAVNGGFFDTRNGMSLGRLIDDGAVRALDHPKFSAGLGIDSARHARIALRRATGWSGDCSELLATGPLLVEGHEVVRNAAWTRQTVRHPRTALGTRADGSVLLLTVDGRSPHAAGLTLLELARVLQQLGCERALNLDGGGSTTMWVRDRGIVNHPSDNGQFDAGGERGVANAVLVQGRRRFVVDDGDDRARCTPERAFETVRDDHAFDGQLRQAGDSPANRTARPTVRFLVDLPPGTKPWQLDLRRPARPTDWVISFGPVADSTDPVGLPPAATSVAPSRSSSLCSSLSSVRVAPTVTGAERAPHDTWLPVGRFPAAGSQPARVEIRVSSRSGPLWIDAIRLSER